MLSRVMSIMTIEKYIGMVSLEVCITYTECKWVSIGSDWGKLSTHITLP